MATTFTQRDFAYASHVIERLRWVRGSKLWWWGWTLAYEASRMVCEHRAHVEHSHMVNRLVRVAHDIRELNGAWPAEILVRDRCSVSFITVIDPPFADDSVFDPLAYTAESTFKRVNIPVSVCRGGEKPADLWCYRETADGALIEFVASNKWEQ
jgi:hypothetical protein